MLTQRGRLALLLAAAFYLLAWGFGTEEAYPLAVGLAIAVVASAVLVRLGSGPFRLTRRMAVADAVEGADLPVGVEIRAEHGLLPHGARLLDHVGGEEVAVPLERHGDALRGRYVLHGLPRGRYGLAAAELVVEDPFGLQRTVTELAGGRSLVVYPRVVELERLFTDSGGLGGDGRSNLLSRTSGYDLHGVRDYQPGESLRAVHWKSTAKRRRLMVKELEDAPREEAAVVLDAQAGSDIGRAPDSSFEMQVRAAASVLRRLAAAGRRSALVINGARPLRVPVATLEGDWHAALEALADVRPDGRIPLAAALDEGRSGSDAQRLLLVTAALDGRLADRVSSLAVRREVGVVWVDARTWAEHPSVELGPPDAVALTLARRGVPVARVRRGDDLHGVLDAPRASAAARREAVPV